MSSFDIIKENMEIYRKGEKAKNKIVEEINNILLNKEYAEFLGTEKLDRYKHIVEVKLDEDTDEIKITEEYPVWGGETSQKFEGIAYNKSDNSFTFDFETDNGNSEIIKLVNDGLKESDIFSNCYYYQYEFEDNADSKVRKEFINYIKFPDDSDNKNISRFIKNAVDSLHRTINLYDYNVIVFPESKSELTRKTVNYIYSCNQPKCLTFEIIKNTPKDIEFDYDSFEKEVLSKTMINKYGKEIPCYNQRQKQEVLHKIEEMMNDIHNKDYFSVARDFGAKSKYRKFLNNFYMFRNGKEKAEFKNLLKPKILLVDDILTSGTTALFLLKTIKMLNPDAEVTVFTLIEKEFINI